MRSCSPSLRVVPSYLISFTKHKANIFSDLSFAVGREKEIHEEDRKLESSQLEGDVCIWDCLFMHIFLPCACKFTFVYSVYLQTNNMKTEILEPETDWITVNNAPWLTSQVIQIFKTKRGNPSTVLCILSQLQSRHNKSVVHYIYYTKSLLLLIFKQQGLD